MAVGVLCTVCILGLYLSQVIPVTSAGDSDISEEKKKVFLSVAKAVLAVQQAGGTSRILQDDQFKEIPPNVQQIIYDLDKLEKEQRKTNEVNADKRVSQNVQKRGKFPISKIPDFWEFATTVAEAVTAITKSLGFGQTEDKPHIKVSKR